MPRPSKAAAARAEQADKIADEWFRKINEDDTPTDDEATADLTPTDSTQTDTPDTPTEPVVALVRPDPSGPDKTALTSVQANVRMVENRRRHHLLAYESDTWHALTADLAAAEACLSDDRLVDDAIRDRIRRRVQAWDLQVPVNQGGIDNAQGGGS